MTGEALTHETLRQWLGEGRRVVDWLLVEVLGSAPLDIGARRPTVGAR